MSYIAYKAWTPYALMYSTFKYIDVPVFLHESSPRVPMQEASQTLVPAPGLDLAADVASVRKAGSGHSCIDRRFALLGDSGLLQKNTTEKVVRRMTACFLKG